MSCRLSSGAIPVRLLIILITLFASPGGIPALAENTDDAGLDRIREFLTSVDSLQANFRQRITDQNHQLVEQATGTVSLKRPGRFRWDYAAPYERVVVADGERVWMYEVDLEQVTVRPMGASLGETPAALLAGDPAVLDRFEYLGYERVDGIIWVQLQPGSAAADFEYIRLGFDQQNLVQLELGDRLGRSTHMTFSDIQVNGELDDGLFRLDVPENVDIIGAGEG